MPTSCEHSDANSDLTKGHVYVMTHSLFSGVVRIGCTKTDPENYTETLSKTVPGSYNLVFAQYCENPCEVKKKVKDSLQAKAFVNEFYEVPREIAERMIKRESFRIPIDSLI